MFDVRAYRLICSMTILQRRILSQHPACVVSMKFLLLDFASWNFTSGVLYLAKSMHRHEPTVSRTKTHTQAGHGGSGSCTSDASRAKNHCESHLSMSAWSWKGLLCFSSISWTRAISPAASICFCLFLIISSAARACGAPRSRHCLRLSSSVCHLPRFPLVPHHWNTNEKVLLEVLSCHMLHGRNANL